MLRSLTLVGKRPAWTLLRRFQSNVPANPLVGKDVAEQAPNRTQVWSKNQRERSVAIDNARFEQTDLAAQPRPMAAIDLIAEIPVVQVAGRKAVCNGGGGALGHPRVYINLDEGKPQACGYCGLRFQQEPHHHHH
ncbi:zinc-finger domain-containing protein [Syncephalis plumigaleata]|nr:zinc-finger domain-containing protein [Syncephalis plumigaleata]